MRDEKLLLQFERVQHRVHFRAVLVFRRRKRPGHDHVHVRFAFNESELVVDLFVDAFCFSTEVGDLGVEAVDVLFFDFRLRLQVELLGHRVELYLAVVALRRFGGIVFAEVFERVDEFFFRLIDNDYIQLFCGILVLQGSLVVEVGGGGHVLGDLHAVITLDVDGLRSGLARRKHQAEHSCSGGNGGNTVDHV